MKCNKNEMKNINLNECGLLYGLSPINYNIVKLHQENIDYNRIKKDETIQCIAPSIRHILCKILDTENQFHIFKREPDAQISVMNMFNVNDIIDGLDTLYSELLPISEKYLPNIDNQAELTALFCSNYVHVLVKRWAEVKKRTVINNKLKIKDEKNI